MISEETIDEIERIYNSSNNLSLTKIVEDYPFCREAIRQRLLRRGMKLRNNRDISKNKDKINREYLIKVYNKVKSLRKVRKITGYSINYIKKIASI